MSSPTIEDIKVLVWEMRETAVSAVEHVAFSNYVEREREALRWVREAADKLEIALCHL